MTGSPDNHSGPIIGKTLKYEQLRAICLQAGLDDVGFVELDRPGLADQKDLILRVYPQTRTLISTAIRLNPANARTPARHLNAMDIHLVENEMGLAARAILKKLRGLGVHGVFLSPAFPMDMMRQGPAALNVSHKPLAEEAGLGLMGHSRLILHPRFGAAFCLSGLLIDADLDRYDQRLENNPCFKCKMCAAACPVGAIGDTEQFDGMACLIHNYREVILNFMDFVDALVTSPDMAAYRERFSDAETLSWWQSLAYGPNYQCNHCLGVCPAGEENRGEYESNPKAFYQNVVKPLLESQQTVYVLEGSPAEAQARRHPNKKIKYVKNPLG